MDARLTELEARPVTPDASRLLRALRAEAQLIAALTVQRVRFAQDEPRPEPDDPFAEFDASIDGWIRRGERRRAAEGKDGQEQ
jgi:hypothetical protein